MESSQRRAILYALLGKHGADILIEGIARSGDRPDCLDAQLSRYAWTTEMQAAAGMSLEAEVGQTSGGSYSRVQQNVNSTNTIDLDGTFLNRRPDDPSEPTTAWTTEKPTKAGWYWYRFNDEWGKSITRVVGVNADLVFMSGVDLIYVSLAEGEWAGPLEVPE